jgi:hypothetical protein
LPDNIGLLNYRIDSSKCNCKRENQLEAML